MKKVLLALCAVSALAACKVENTRIDRAESDRRQDAGTQMEQRGEQMKQEGQQLKDRAQEIKSEAR